MAWKPYRPIGWVVAGPIMAAAFLLTGLVAVCVWLLLPKWSRNVNLTPLCENCGRTDEQHSGLYWCPDRHVTKWSQSEPVEWKKKR